MTIKPLTSDTILRLIDEDNKKFFRNNISCVTTLIELYRFGDTDIIPYPVTSCSRRASSFTELLVYIPELLSDFYNNLKQYDTNHFYCIAKLEITPIVGSSVTFIHDPLTLSGYIHDLLSIDEQDDILKNFNNEESKTPNRVDKE